MQDKHTHTRTTVRSTHMPTLRGGKSVCDGARSWGWLEVGCWIPASFFFLSRSDSADRTGRMRVPIRWCIFDQFLFLKETFIWKQKAITVVITIEIPKLVGIRWLLHVFVYAFNSLFWGCIIRTCHPLLSFPVLLFSHPTPTLPSHFQIVVTEIED